MKLDLYQQSGTKKGTLDVSDAIFKAPINNELMRLAVIRQLAHQRQANAHTKTKAEVRGGGKKPFAQKHTGRARAGSIRSPLWRGGGIIFGPRNVRNYTKRMTKEARRNALFSALSSKAAESAVFALDQFEIKAPKTAEFVKLLKKLPVQKSLLVVISEANPAIEKSIRNLPNVTVIQAKYLNLHDILTHEKVMFLESAIKTTEELYLK